MNVKSIKLVQSTSIASIATRIAYNLLFSVLIVATTK